MEKPRVSVVMSVYNGERYLREAVESILGQTFTDFEFIIIDDGSTDSSWHILNSFDDPRLRFVRNEANIGLTHSLNKGLALARGEYIARMDADDISLPERLAKQVQFLDAHPFVGVLGTAVRTIDSLGKPGREHATLVEPNIIRWTLCLRNCLAHSSVVMRRDLVRRVGAYDTSAVYAQDYDLWTRLAQVTCLANLPEPLIYLRIHDTSVSQIRHAEQVASASRSSSRMMGYTLGTTLPQGIVNALQGADACTAARLSGSARVIQDLYRAFTQRPGLSAQERRFIRRDAARRIRHLLKTAPLDGHSLRMGLLVARLAPIDLAIWGLRKMLPTRLFANRQ